MPARIKDETYLCKYCEAQLGRPYWRGTFGQHASQALFNFEQKRFPADYTASDFPAQIKAGQKVHDCCGLVKAANMCETVNSDPETGDAETFKKFDLNPQMYYDRARVKGPISTFPKRKGYLVYHSDLLHVGVYMGDGTVIEARGHSYGVVRSSISEKRWALWSDDININYTEQPTPAPAPSSDSVKFSDLKMIRKGDSGVEVKTIQANVGVFVDGVFGNDTDAAVKKFQKANGLESDGIVGPLTWEKIIRKWEK